MNGFDYIPGGSIIRLIAVILFTGIFYVIPLIRIVKRGSGL